MIRVNLLPRPERKRQERPAAPSRTRRGAGVPDFAGEPWMLVVGGAGLLVLLLSGYNLWQTGAQAAELQTQIEREQADSIRFASTIDLVTTLQARQDTIQQQIGVIRGVDERRYVWPHLLDQISDALPAFVWLNAIRSSGDTEAPTFTLEGNAASTQSLTRFMTNLETSPFVRDVTLVTSELVSEAGMAFQRFTLEARYERPDDSVIETVPIIIID